MRNRIFNLFALGILMVSSAAASSGQTITSLAGSGPNLLPATQSNLNVPQAITQDSNGDVYIAAGARVFKVDSGTLTVYAGNGYAGSTGDGGAAISARLNSPTGLAFDRNDNLYILDAGSGNVRRVDANTKKISTPVGDGGTLPASLLAPGSITFDPSGNLYISDVINSVVYKVNSSFSTINVYAGIFGDQGTVGEAQLGDGRQATDTVLGGPHGLASDGAGNLYVADQINNVVRKIDPTTHITKIVAGQAIFSTIPPFPPVGDYSGDGGLATAARLNKPWGLSVDNSANVYITDSLNNVVRRVDHSSKVITTVNTGSFVLANPLGVTGKNNKIQIVDTDNLRVINVNVSSNQATLFAGNGTASYSGDGFVANRGALSAQGVATDLLGNIYVADQTNNIIRRIDAFTKVMTTVAGTPATIGDSDGSPATSGLLNGPAGVAVDLIGNVYIADSLNFKVRKVDAITHAMTTIAGANGELSFPQGVATDLLGNVYIGDTFNCVVWKLDRNQNLTVYAGSLGTCDYFGDSGPATAAGLFFPVGVSTDLLGNLYIADSVNNVVRRVDSRTHNITTVAGTFGSVVYDGNGGPATSASIGFPTGIDVDLLGNLFVTDTFNNVVWRVDARSQVITNVAGDPNSTADIGDGGPASAAFLNQPGGVAVDLLGTLYIGDTGNARVRQVR